MTTATTRQPWGASLVGATALVLLHAGPVAFVIYRIAGNG